MCPRQGMCEARSIRIGLHMLPWVSGIAAKAKRLTLASDQSRACDG